MNISVVMPTYNNCDRLRDTLKAFTKLIVSHEISWELIVVDNNSNDSTKDVIEEYVDKLPLRYFHEKKQGVSNAKNTGIANSKGELIVCADDDISPCSDWLEIYWREYLINSTEFFWGGPIVSEFEVPPMDIELISLGPASVKGLNWGEEQRVLNNGEFFIGPNWAAPAKAIKAVGGYNAELGLNPATGKVLVGEENDLMDRMQSQGLKPIYLPNATVKHFVPKSKMTIKHIADRAEATGRFSAEWVSNSPSPSVFGIPRWIWRKLITYKFKATFKKYYGVNWRPDYVEYKRLLGCVKQIRANSKHLEITE